MQNDNEIKYYGIHTCLSLFKNRPQDIIKVYLDESNLRRFSLLLKWCSSNKKAYKKVTNLDLNKITQSIHHEGVCILAKQITNLTFNDLLKDLKDKKSCCLLYLDNIENPHNIGSIIRTCAHFDVKYILCPTTMPPLSSSTYRIAKDASFSVSMIYLNNYKKALGTLKETGFSCFATSSHYNDSIYNTKFPKKLVIIMGSETKGISRPIEHIVDKKITIPGSNQVESLNVSVATALLIGEYWRQHE